MALKVVAAVAGAIDASFIQIYVTVKNQAIDLDILSLIVIYLAYLSPSIAP